MAHDVFFHLALLGVMVASVTIAAIQYAQAAVPGEPVSRRDEGLPMFVALRLAGLILFVATLAYLINPEWMALGRRPLADWVRWSGAVLALFGVVLLYWTLDTLGPNLTDTVTTRPNHTLVTTGPYHWVRHPYYSTTLVLVVGAALLAANWFIGMLGLAVFALLALRTPKEEQNLIERFGDDYRAYMEKTGRFVPRFWRAAKSCQPQSDAGAGLALEVLDGKTDAPKPAVDVMTETVPNHPGFILFIGGPLDGHRQNLAERKGPLPTWVHLEISRNTYRLLANQPLTLDDPTTSLATYELRFVEGVGSYCFVVARAPAQKPTAGG